MCWFLVDETTEDASLLLEERSLSGAILRVERQREVDYRGCQGESPELCNELVISDCNGFIAAIACAGASLGYLVTHTRPVVKPMMAGLSPR